MKFNPADDEEDTCVPCAQRGKTMENNGKQLMENKKQKNAEKKWHETDERRRCTLLKIVLRGNFPHFLGRKFWGNALLILGE